MYQALATDAKQKPEKDLQDALIRTRDEVTSSAIVPIAILNAEIGQPNGKEKEVFIGASPLQKDVFQANIFFKISPKLLQSNISNKIDSVAFSYDEGLSWETYAFTEQLIPHTFPKLGTYSVGIKLVTKKGAFIIFSEMIVKQLTRQTDVETLLLT